MTVARTLVLAIETSNPSASADGAGASGVALGRLGAGGAVDVLGRELLRSRGSAAGGAGVAARGGHDDDLLPAIDRVFARLGADAGELAWVAVSAGPGGYTGLRVACAAGAMVALARGAKCVRVPSALVVLESVDQSLRLEGPIAVALASKNDSAWVQVFEGGAEVGAGSLLNAEGLERVGGRGVRTLIADRFLPEAMRAGTERMGMRVVEPVYSAEACLRVAARLTPVDPAELVPLYPREPDAVTLWREKKGTK